MNRESERKRLVELIMRDRLIEILKHRRHLETSELADYLLANDIVVSPVKVGNIVYFVARNNGKPIGTIDEMEIVMIGKTETGYCAKGKLGETTFDIIPHFEIDNYTFFTSREEAEKMLKGEGK